MPVNNRLLAAPRRVRPQISLVLVDWSVRESAHILDYLNRQTLPRHRYEIIWVEFYDRRFPAIEQKASELGAENLGPAVDQWIVLDMPREAYYHKHLMYNAGIYYSQGDIVTICDSDGIVSPTFVESIANAFEREPSMVLHMDQLRNFSRSYYPFNYPSLQEIRDGAGNLCGGKPFGLVDTEDLLHSRNYGACFSALRRDLIEIGGADEHIDYLGHACGPYEMTWRLTNRGLKEVWHPTEFTYHVWHPGQAGDRNYAGPHDGKMISTTALAVKTTKRIKPLVENAFIAALREADAPIDSRVSIEDFSRRMKGSPRVDKWIIDLTSAQETRLPCNNHYIVTYSNERLDAPPGPPAKSSLGPRAITTVKQVLRALGIGNESWVYRGLKRAKIVMSNAMRLIRGQPGRASVVGERERVPLLLFCWVALEKIIVRLGRLSLRLLGGLLRSAINARNTPRSPAAGAQPAIDDIKKLLFRLGIRRESSSYRFLSRTWREISAFSVVLAALCPK